MIIECKIIPLPASHHKEADSDWSSTMEWRLSCLSRSILLSPLVNVQNKPSWHWVPPEQPAPFCNLSKLWILFHNLNETLLKDTSRSLKAVGAAGIRLKEMHLCFRMYYHHNLAGLMHFSPPGLPTVQHSLIIADYFWTGKSRCFALWDGEWHTWSIEEFIITRTFPGKTNSLLILPSADFQREGLA